MVPCSLASSVSQNDLTANVDSLKIVRCEEIVQCGEDVESMSTIVADLLWLARWPRQPWFQATATAVVAATTSVMGGSRRVADDLRLDLEVDRIGEGPAPVA